MNNPKVTVYITNYNYEAYLNQAVDSVLNQTYPNIDLLIIDDGSKDNSRELIQAYSVLPNVEILFQQNLGLNKTNNVALRLAKGKYLVRLDADDFFEPNAIETMVNVLESDNEIGLVFPDYYYVDKYGKRIGEEKRHDFENEVSVYDQPAHGACTMVRSEMLRNLGGYDEQFSCQDGYDLWIKFVSNHKVNNINQPLFSYRRHGNNLTENESRILRTRREIKRVYVSKKKTIPKTLVIIPVRQTLINGIDWLLEPLLNQTILANKIKTCLEAKNPSMVVITSSSDEIKRYVEHEFKAYSNFQFVNRSEELEMSHISLAQTIEHIIGSLKISFEAVMTISLEFPFIPPNAIDEAIDTMVIFNSDSVVSVQADNSIYYQHKGNGMKPILDQDKFTKYEREALYKSVGGIMLTKLINLIETKKSISGKVAHILVDNKEAFNVSNSFSYNVYKLLLVNKT